MAYERWNADNAALLLIDHQVGTIGWKPKSALPQIPERWKTHPGDRLTRIGLPSLVRTAYSNIGLYFVLNTGIFTRPLNAFR